MPLFWLSGLESFLQRHAHFRPLDAFLEIAVRTIGMARKLGVQVGIDTANQRKHYVEAAVGDALADAYAAGTIRREHVFVGPSSRASAGRTFDCRTIHALRSRCR